MRFASGKDLPYPARKIGNLKLAAPPETVAEHASGILTAPETAKEMLIASVNDDELGQLPSACAHCWFFTRKRIHSRSTTHFFTMAETPSSVSSELSSHSDNEFPSEMPASSPRSPAGGSQVTISDHENDELLSVRPAKRRRTARPRTPVSRSSPASNIRPPSPDTDISSDSETSLPPQSPKNTNLADSAKDEFTIADEFNRVCRWDGCDVGDLGNQDNLVQHVLDTHAGQTKPKSKYLCEWVDCKHKGKQQMSAYALRAHMRSHTKEKPFYCELPECDKSFTRSDALSKHMKTVHFSENPLISAPYTKLHKARDANLAAVKEAATPTSAASPAPKLEQTDSKGDDQPSARTHKLKLVLNANSKSAPSTPEALNGTSNAPQSPVSPSMRDEVFGSFPSDLDFTPDELAMPRDRLFALLRRQIKWAEEDQHITQREIEESEAKRRKEWAHKELVLSNLMEAEVAKAEEKGILDGISGKSVNGMLEYADKDASTLPIRGYSPWYRKDRARRRADPAEIVSGSIERPGENVQPTRTEAEGYDTESMGEEIPASEAGL